MKQISPVSLYQADLSHSPGRDPACAARLIFHVDMDAFFAALEVASDPRLEGLPIMVCGLPEHRSVVSCASYPARRFGVRAGMPVMQARRLCPEGIFITGDMHKYEYYSVLMLGLLESFSPLVEPVSVDEAWLDMGPWPEADLEPARCQALAIKQAIWECLNVTATIGMAPNKLLAKMASKLQKPDGLTILAAEDVRETLWPLPVEKLYGVGEKTATILSGYGIATIGDLAEFPLTFLERHLGQNAAGLQAAARGWDMRPVITPERMPAPKSLGHELTLPCDIWGEAGVCRVLSQLADRVAARLRQQDLMAGALTLKLRYSDFSTHTHALKLESATDIDTDLYVVAAAGFRAIRSHPCPGIRLVGLTATRLRSADEPRQLLLKDLIRSCHDPDSRRHLGWLDMRGEPLPVNSDERHRVVEVIDRIRQRWGRQSIERGRVRTNDPDDALVRSPHR